MGDEMKPKTIRFSRQNLNIGGRIVYFQETEGGQEFVSLDDYQLAKAEGMREAYEDAARIAGRQASASAKLAKSYREQQQQTNAMECLLQARQAEEIAWAIRNAAHLPKATSGEGEKE